MLLGLLVGCGGSWIDQTPACGKDVYDWSDDLLAYVASGDGSGSFDLDPQDVPREEIVGAYHVNKGNFRYTTTYGTDYWLTESTTEGYGTVFHNGNLDLIYQTVATDRLGEEITTSTRLERQGCETQWSTWTGTTDETTADVFTRAGKFVGANKFTWTAESDDYDYEGADNSDASSSFITTAKDGSASYNTSYDPEGTSHSDWTTPCVDADHECVGTTDVEFNGDYTQEYVLNQNGEKIADFSWNYEYSGDGTGTGVFYGKTTVTCDYEVKASGSCSYTCDDKSKGDC